MFLKGKYLWALKNGRDLNWRTGTGQIEKKVRVFTECREMEVSPGNEK